MLPDFPEIKNKWSTRFYNSITQRIRQVPILAQVSRITHFEGDGMKTTDVEGRTESSEYDTMSGMFEISRKDLIDQGPACLNGEIDRIVQKLADQQISAMLERVRESTRRTGNLVSTGGQGFDSEHFLSLLEKIEIDFDDDGRHNTLSFVVPPGLQNQLQAKMGEWMKDASFRNKHDEIISKKRQEWNDRESNRKLVD